MTKTQTLDYNLLKLIFKVDLLWFYNLESKISNGRLKKIWIFVFVNKGGFGDWDLQAVT